MMNSDSAIDITWERVLTVWWAFFWRFAIYAMVLGFVLGFVGGAIVGLLGRPDLGAPVGAVLGWLGSVPISLDEIAFAQA